MSWKGIREKAANTGRSLALRRLGHARYIQPGCAEPETLVEACTPRSASPQRRNRAHVDHGLCPYVAPEMEGHFGTRVFIGPMYATPSMTARRLHPHLPERDRRFVLNAPCRRRRSHRVSPPDSRAFAASAWASIPRSLPPNALAGGGAGQ